MTETRAYRDGGQRWVAGVAAGLAEHLGWPVGWTRAGFVLLTLAGGLGGVLYAAYWLFLPLRRGERERELGLLPILALGGLLLGAALLSAAALRVTLNSALLVAVAVAGVGAAIVWRQADDEQRAAWGSDRGATRWWRLGLGLGLVLAGAMLLVFGAADPAQAARGLLVGALVAAGLILLALPWILRQWETANAERAERIRADERAEVAAQVHDSVLQTLTLIRSNAGRADTVAQLARAEERRLRTWLYQPAGDPDATLRPALENLAAQVEAEYPVTIEVVTVGDAPLTPRATALLAAAREALTNAAKHAPGQITVYAEVETQGVSVFVRDRGPGFDPASVPSDRLGVRESIVGRMERNGGRAVIRSGGRGTEVALTMETP